MECIAVVAYLNEDELPSWVDDEMKERIKHSSSLVDGCRVYPYITLCGKQVFLMIPPPECVVELPVEMAEQAQPTTIPNKCAFIKLDIDLAQKQLECAKRRIDKMLAEAG